MIDHTLHNVKKYFDEILIVSNDKELKIEDQKITIIQDCIDGYLGPLVGVLSAMKYANLSKTKRDWIITFPCDTPFFDEKIIEEMIKKTNIIPDYIVEGP